MEDINTQTITSLQKQLTADWHHQTPAVTRDGLLALVEGNHLQNFSLWHEEDKARRDDMGHEYVYHAKRNIDKFNQERNNFMERIDQFICNLIGDMPTNCPMHTETPGMIIDRLSIMSLKEYHMEEETLRTDVSDDHKQQCAHKLSVLRQQLSDLTSSLQELINQVLAKQRGFRVYYQFKMYNDPSLNPQLYKKQKT